MEIEAIIKNMKAIYSPLIDFIDTSNNSDAEFRKNYKKQIEDDLLAFEKKCQIGENDSYICSLIRTDSVEEFIAYTNRINLSLLTIINPSVYETNSFLINKHPTLIEYATFFGSIQIIRYLKYNKVPLTSSLWVYTIHSNNAELIHFLEENKVKPGTINSNKRFFRYSNRSKSYEDVLIESIKCHHNAISNYINDEHMKKHHDNQFYLNFNNNVVDSDH